jgi:hypothetical protein
MLLGRPTNNKTFNFWSTNLKGSALIYNAGYGSVLKPMRIHNTAGRVFTNIKLGPIVAGKCGAK